MFIFQDIDDYETTGSDKCLQFDRKIVQHIYRVVSKLQRKYMAHARYLFCRRDGFHKNYIFFKFPLASGR